MKKKLLAIQKLINEPQVAPALDAVAKLELRLGNGPAIVAAADQVGNAAHDFAEQADRSKLTAIDPMLPNPRQYKN